MGEKVTIKSMEVIYNGLFQIDIWFENQKKGDRIFVEPSELFKMIGDAMQKNLDDYKKKNF